MLSPPWLPGDSFCHVLEPVLCLKLGEKFGLFCLSPGSEKHWFWKVCTLNRFFTGFCVNNIKILVFWATVGGGRLEHERDEMQKERCTKTNIRRRKKIFD